MGRLLVAIIVITVTTFLNPQIAHAQNQELDKVEVSYGPRKQMATIIFAGLAGAVLGLSTLSFYPRPQDKLANIPIGAAIGIICGTVYTTYKTATRPYERYDEAMFDPVMQNQNYAAYQFEQINKPQVQLNYSWDF